MSTQTPVDILNLHAGDPYLRANYIGSSDAAIIAGVSPWCTPYQLWKIKSGQCQPKKVTPAMQNGIDKEDQARQEFIKYKGIDVSPKRLISSDHPWMIASLDGISEDANTLVEIKCPGHRDHLDAYYKHIPEKYMPQLQHQMYVAAVESMYYFSYVKSEFICLEVKYDESFFLPILEKEKRFYECMITNTSPELCDRDYVKVDDSYWEYISNRYKSLQELKKEIDLEEQGLRSILIDLCKEKNCMGNGLKVRNVYRKGAIDYSIIPQLKGMELDKYRRPSSNSWRISCGDCE